MKKHSTIFPLCPIIALLFLVSCTHTAKPPTRAQALYLEGQTLLSEGRPEEALARFSRSLALSREQNDPRGIAHNLNEIGILHTQRQAFDKARTCFLEAEAMYRDLGMEAEVSKSLNNRAMSHVLERDHSSAVDVYEELLEWDEATGNRLGRAITLTNLGQLYEVHLEEPDKALAAYEQALTLLTELGDEGRAATVRDRVERLSSEGTR